MQISQASDKNEVLKLDLTASGQSKLLADDASPGCQPVILRLWPRPVLRSKAENVPTGQLDLELAAFGRG